MRDKFDNFDLLRDCQGLDFGSWNLFVIWCLCFVIYPKLYTNINKGLAFPSPQYNFTDTFKVFRPVDADSLMVG